jgi:hypothetical protein
LKGTIYACIIAFHLSVWEGFPLHTTRDGVAQVVVFFFLPYLVYLPIVRQIGKK